MPIASEFKELIVRGSVVDLATSVVVGTAFSGTIKSLIDDIIMPPTSILAGGVDFSNLLTALKDGTPAPEVGHTSLAAAKAVGAVTLNAGLFISIIISFLIIVAAISVVAKLLNSLKKKEVPVEEAPAELSEEVLLPHEIRGSLSKK